MAKRKKGFFSRPSDETPTHQPVSTGRIQRRMPGQEPDATMPLPQMDPERPERGRREPPVKPPRKRPKPVKEGKKRRRLGRRILGWSITGGIVALSVLVISIAIMLVYTTRNDDLWLDLEQIPYRGETILYYTDRQTGEVVEYTRLPSTQPTEYVPQERIPQQLKNAFVAIEDQTFYEHNGVSLRRTLYAVVNELKHSITGSYIGGDEGRKQGASTIDQQLIKNLTRDDDDSDMAGYLRKIREIFRAYRLDADYDKDTIISAYLNVITFTGNTAGVQAEARKLFGKDVEALSLAECASLAAITRNPSRYNPATNPEIHLDRRNYVLQEMLNQELITQAEYDAAVAAPLELAGNTQPARQQEVTSYFTDVVITEVLEQLQQQRGVTRKEAVNLLYNGGLRIYITMVPELQQSMERVMTTGSAYPRTSATVTKQQYDEDGNPLLDDEGEPVYARETVYPQAAMISLDYDGAICAVVGGLGEKEISLGFNRATSAVRQVGSTMKPIGPYAVAFEQNKITWSSMFLDAPVRQIEDESTGEEKDWPVNATNSYTNKDILVKDAFAKSVNTVAVRVGDLAGNYSMYSLVANGLGVSTLTSEDKDSGPLVLGSSTYGISPLEMARAYSVFGNGGKLPTVHSFTKITSGSGKILLEPELKTSQPISEDTAYVINRLMLEVMRDGGTASGMAINDGMESVGKTGTTNDHRDHWFIGLTPYYVTASWYGYDENLPLGVSSHWNPPILAWRDALRRGQDGLPAKEFEVSSSAVEAKYCTGSGYAAGPNCPSATGWYRLARLPEEGCPVHGG